MKKLTFFLFCAWQWPCWM